VWHDRTDFHFLTRLSQPARYIALVDGAVPAGGAVIVATFTPDRPTHCPGLDVRRYDA